MQHKPIPVQMSVPIIGGNHNPTTVEVQPIHHAVPLVGANTVTVTYKTPNGTKVEGHMLGGCPLALHLAAMVAQQTSVSDAQLTATRALDTAEALMIEYDRRMRQAHARQNAQQHDTEADSGTG